MIKSTFETRNISKKKSCPNCYKNDVAFLNTTKISTVKKSPAKMVKQGALFGTRIKIFHS
jgi:hypothetical protein